MGRTIPSFRISLATEKEDWKPFRNALDKSDRKKFDEMWDLPKWYISACSNSVQYVRLHPILMSDEYYNNEKTDISKEYCTNEFCGRKLIYSDKIGKMFCPVCFYHLTDEEKEALFAPNVPAEDTVSDDIERGIIHPNEEGFLPMRRGGKTDTIARQEEEGSGGKTVVRQLSRVERIREKRRALEFPGLDDDLRRTVSKVGGTIVKTEEHLPTGDKQTLTGDELNNMRESRNKHQYFSVS